MTLTNNKKHHISNNRNVGVGEDKISNLPDALIHHILSFLPTKCAMSTCILSKRWNYAAYSVPTLYFRNWRTRENTRKEIKLGTKLLMNFLDTILFLHEKPHIQKFYLEVDGFFDESRVSRWISTIVKRKVEEFVLSVEKAHNLNPSSILPRSFFTCDSLTLLDLDFQTLTGGKFNIPNNVSFPKLKILRLTYLVFGNKTSIRSFFSNCPILEELCLSKCLMTEGFCIANPALKHLSISTYFLGALVVEISAPNLLTISCGGALPEEFVLNTFPSLVKAEVISDGMGKPFVKLFEKLSNAKILKINAGSFLVLREADILLTGSLTFNNLTHLEVSSYRSRYSSLDPISAVGTFFKFLQLSPSLKSIVFPQSTHIPDEVDVGCWSLDPKSSPPLLESIKFMYFDGELTELNVIKHFLRYIGFLETLTIVASPRLSNDHKKQLKIAKLLLMFPKASNCVVKFLTISEVA